MSSKHVIHPDREMLFDYFTRRLTPLMTKKMEEHLQTCFHCRSILMGWDIALEMEAAERQEKN